MTGLQSATTDRTNELGWQRIGDYVSLGKPRVVVMVMAITAVGFYMGTVGTPDWPLLLHLLLGTALAAGGTLALNAYLERDVDALMQRTELRPLPGGRLSPISAKRFGLTVTILGIGYLAFMAHPLSALITAVTTVSYLFFYTPLKRTTSLCSLVGAVAGALPPVTGWAAAQGTLGGQVWVLFAILFLWQLPHSLAIAWLYRDDYTRAGFALLPVIHPDGSSTGRQIMTNSLALLAVSLLPTLVGLTGIVYFVVALVLGLIFLGFGIEVAYTRTVKAARRLLVVSLIHLPLTFLVMALDKIPTV